MNKHPDLHVVLVSNYVPDGQPSMQRFASLLHEGLAAQGVRVEALRPPVVVGGRNAARNGVGKWLGYLDKFLLYPPRLARAARCGASTVTVVHICDHSNAIYVPQIRALPHVVTCHDLIAVRSALGEFPGERPRWSGRRLQQMIRQGLRQAACIVSDSETTRSDVQRLVGGIHRDRVIHPSVSPTFTRQTPVQARARLARLQPDPGGAVQWPQAASQPYILHIGGDQWYKNRAGLIDIYAALVDRMPAAPPLVLAGKPLTRDVNDRITAHALHNHVVAFSNVTDADLAALYSSATLLLFPSLAEGFGWPVLEAMACGCRVVASGRAPITEVATDAATYIDPTDPAAAAATAERVLREPDTDRRAFIAAGLSRALAFSTVAMAQGYVSVYQDVLARYANVA